MKNNKHNNIIHSEDGPWTSPGTSQNSFQKDTKNIPAWFIEVMPTILENMLNNLTGYPEENNGIPIHEYSKAASLNGNRLPGMEEWEKVLRRMVFLLNEMDPSKCTYENPVQKEIDEVRENLEKEGCGYLAEHLEETNDPELQLLYQEYRYHEQQKWHYRDRCCTEFFSLFSKWFWHLWN